MQISKSKPKKSQSCVPLSGSTPSYQTQAKPLPATQKEEGLKEKKGDYG